jgi:hypothetical protein
MRMPTRRTPCTCSTPRWPQAGLFHAAEITGHLLNGVIEPVLRRAFQFWKNVDSTIGERVENGAREWQA